MASHHSGEFIMNRRHLVWKSFKSGRPNRAMTIREPRPLVCRSQNNYKKHTWGEPRIPILMNRERQTFANLRNSIQIKQNELLVPHVSIWAWYIRVHALEGILCSCFGKTSGKHTATLLRRPSSNRRAWNENSWLAATAMEWDCISRFSHQSSRWRRLHVTALSVSWVESTFSYYTTCNLMQQQIEQNLTLWSIDD